MPARRCRPRHPRPRAPAAHPAARAHAPAPRTAAWIVSGLATLATLVGLLVLPFWVYASSAAEWESRLASFKVMAAALTVVYFVAGVAWMNENEKRREGGAR